MILVFAAGALMGAALVLTFQGLVAVLDEGSDRTLRTVADDDTLSMDEVHIP